MQQLNWTKSSTRVTADASGNLLSTLRYSAFGETRYASGSTSTDYRYTGQREEAELGLYFYNARWYDPSLGRFIQPDTIVPDPGSPMDWDRYAYVRNNPINYTDPTGHAYKVDDDGNSRECPAGTCYITMVGSTPGLPYYTPSPVTYGQNAENSSSGGGSMDGNSLPGVTDPRFTIKQPRYRDPSAVVGAMGIVNDLLLYVRNRLVETEDRKINVFAYYRVGEDGFSVQSLDVQNPTGADVSVMGVLFSTSQSGYEAYPGPSFQPFDGYYGFSPVGRAKSTTTVSIVPSGHTYNPTNKFSTNQSLTMMISLWHTQTGLRYPLIRGGID